MKYCIRNIVIASALVLLSSMAYGQDKKYSNSVFFNSNSYSLDAKATARLDEVINKLQSSSSGCYLKVFGYADPPGTETYNDELSKKRAEAVYDYISKRIKIDTEAVYVTWLGESADVYDLHFAGAHARQRCVDILLCQ